MTIVNNSVGLGVLQMGTRKAAWQGIEAAGISALLVAIALATPPTPNALGVTYKVVSKGQTHLVEIRLKPTTSFDSVRVEAASGAASLTPPCAFSGVVVGGAYVCTVSVGHKAEEASLTLNVVGEKTADPAKPRIVEVSHLTIANAAFVAPAVRRSDKPTPGLILTPGSAKPK